MNCTAHVLRKRAYLPLWYPQGRRLRPTKYGGRQAFRKARQVPEEVWCNCFHKMKDKVKVMGGP